MAGGCDFYHSVPMQGPFTDSFERFAKEYFENNSVTTKDFTVYIAYKLNKLVILVLEDNKWTDISKSTSTDEREVASSRETKVFLAFDKQDYNNIVGFMGYDRGNANLDFKTKNMSVVLEHMRTGLGICVDAPCTLCKAWFAAQGWPLKPRGRVECTGRCGRRAGLPYRRPCPLHPHPTPSPPPHLTIIPRQLAVGASQTPRSPTPKRLRNGAGTHSQHSLAPPEGIRQNES